MAELALFSSFALPKEVNFDMRGALLQAQIAWEYKFYTLDAYVAHSQTF